MENYSIRCGSLDIPEDWQRLEDSDDAIQHASIIFNNDYQCEQLKLQYQDFKCLYDTIKPKKYANIHKRAWLSFQIMFQSECILEINKLREKANLPKLFPTFVFLTEPSV